MESAKELLAQRRALVADLRTRGSDRLTRATIEAQIKMLDGQLAAMRSPSPCRECTRTHDGACGLLVPSEVSR